MSLCANQLACPHRNLQTRVASGAMWQPVPSSLLACLGAYRCTLQEAHTSGRRATEDFSAQHVLVAYLQVCACSACTHSLHFEERPLLRVKACAACSSSPATICHLCSLQIHSLVESGRGGCMCSIQARGSCKIAWLKQLRLLRIAMRNRAEQHLPQMAVNLCFAMSNRLC